ncbi:MAG TPA: HipA domain-containing protein [Pseudobdellovibrionaceae bacterium]|nr:HipA domain-containing protein [Pseudobdellovibrionaceae bacterium]
MNRLGLGALFFLSAIAHHLGLTGVQQKISVDLEKYKGDPSHRLMISGLWGNFILKPPTKIFPDISVVEDATMHMAEIAGITTAKHDLIKLKSGELAYVTKRFDREKNKKKIAMEDFCQLSELLTANKYDSSTEKAGKIILKFASNPGLDAISFFDINIFSFLSGNADMHLKNFSLFQNEDNYIKLSPAYDLLSTKLLLSADKEEMALTVNGKKANLKKSDFVSLGKNLKMNEKSIENSFERILSSIPKMKVIIETSFMSMELKKSYIQLLDRRSSILS